MLLPWSASKDFPSHLEYNSRSLPQSQGPASSGSCLLLGPPRLLLTSSAHFGHADFLDVPEQVSLVSSLDFLPPGQARSCLTSSLGWLLLLNRGPSSRVISARLLQPQEGTVHQQSESIFYPMVSSSLIQVPDALQVMQ